eukprot:PhF_6_TR2022/c0_g1_i3/m.3491
MINVPATTKEPDNSPQHKKEYILTDASLLVNHGVVRHKTNPLPPPRPTTTKDIRNIAIELLIAVQDDYDNHLQYWERMREGYRSGLNLVMFRQFVTVFCPKVATTSATEKHQQG